ncbi:HAMP domain-containing histidine kinase [Ectobacillus sp. JY-23]|uniref:sensor histidine kinase n=1 Tax=Ectobacillus sp. JY-23 TaxID=2933872 RepID=UPI001FF21CB3|nr:HAMP domain-containing sensor histidine kinase [Ectobacillus sp. JY-23]UOY93030.1 HAMP domain-containing histidine kinase [Ectobacillus sp. JY-23]
MKTLYIRFVLTAICILISSSLLAFFLANAYYQVYLKPFNDKKITKIAEETAAFASTLPSISLSDYLKTVAHSGYQIHITNERGQDAYYGSAFKTKYLPHTVVATVLDGQVYHGIKNFPKRLFITGFFDDELINTIGVPFEIDGNKYALFIRPDVELQFGEMRIFFAQLLVLSLILTVLFIFIGTRYIVRPIQILTKATTKIAQGDYDIQLAVDRKDEIGTLATSFERMTESIQRLEEMRQEFVANVSHEIQSPLTSIQGFSHALRTEHVTEEERKQYAAIIEEESRRMSVMSKQLLLLASLDKERDILEWTTFDIGEQIQQIIHAAAWSWREKELGIEMDVPSTYIKGDKRFLHQVWLNLIQNSIKFTESGGTIFISVRMMDKAAIQVTIQDTGQGIHEEDMPYIFDRYYKGDKARTRKESGSGLGLSIVKKIIYLHKGTITVQSEVGKGTVFQVILPR